MMIKKKEFSSISSSWINCKRSEYKIPLGLYTEIQLETGFWHLSVIKQYWEHLHHFISVTEKISIFSSHYLQWRWKIKTGDMCLCLECCIRTAGRCCVRFLALCDPLMWWNDRGSAGVIRHEKLKLFALFNSWEKKSRKNKNEGETQPMIQTSFHNWIVHVSMYAQ